MKCATTPGINPSIPAVVDGIDYSLRVCGAAVRDQIFFQSVDGPFWVTILESKTKIKHLVPPSR